MARISEQNFRAQIDLQSLYVAPVYVWYRGLKITVSISLRKRQSREPETKVVNFILPASYFLLTRYTLRFIGRPVEREEFIVNNGDFPHFAQNKSTLTTYDVGHNRIGAPSRIGFTYWGKIADDDGRYVAISKPSAYTAYKFLLSDSAQQDIFQFARDPRESIWLIYSTSMAIESIDDSKVYVAKQLITLPFLSTNITHGTGTDDNLQKYFTTGDDIALMDKKYGGKSLW